MYAKLLILKLTLLMSIGASFGMKAYAQEAPANLICRSASGSSVGCWSSFYSFFYENNQFSFTKELSTPSGRMCGWPPYGTQVLAKGRIEFYSSTNARIYTSTDKDELEIGEVIIEGSRVELSLYDDELIVLDNCRSYK
ncbi:MULTISPECIES: hypothetical protein [unclassified Halobacteriovorax]|uniref:hypothetical protein n=1 Tax=unclassified Halobacteriovorax TaxID=2639665 RepID=UPI00399B7936